MKWRWTVVIGLAWWAACFFGGMALGDYWRARENERIRRIATDVACRTLVEAELVKSCGTQPLEAPL